MKEYSKILVSVGPGPLGELEKRNPDPSAALSKRSGGNVLIGEKRENPDSTRGQRGTM